MRSEALCLYKNLKNGNRDEIFKKTYEKIQKTLDIRRRGWYNTWVSEFESREKQSRISVLTLPQGVRKVNIVEHPFLVRPFVHTEIRMHFFMEVTNH